MNLIDFLNSIDHGSLSKAEHIDVFAFFISKYLSQDKFQPKEIKALFEEASIAPYSNIPYYLRNSSRKYIYYEKLAKYGFSKGFLDELNLKYDYMGVTSFRNLYDKIDTIAKSKLDNDSAELYAELITCYKNKALRASVILSWILAINHMYLYILNHKLEEFNTALSKASWNKSGLRISVKDDFAEIPKETRFIELCRAASIISNDVKKILDSGLGIRNSYAHPSTIKATETTAANHIEEMFVNIIDKY